MQFFKQNITYVLIFKMLTSIFFSSTVCVSVYSYFNFFDYSTSLYKINKAYYNYLYMNIMSLCNSNNLPSFVSLSYSEQYKNKILILSLESKNHPEKKNHVPFYIFIQILSVFTPI